jgi:hypothetical protein
MAARFLGYDAAANPHLAPAIEQAVRSGTVTASPPLTLFEPYQSIFMLKAVYQGRYAPPTQDGRRSLLHGVIALELPEMRFLEDLMKDHRDFDVPDTWQRRRQPWKEPLCPAPEYGQSPASSALVAPVYLPPRN